MHRIYIDQGIRNNVVTISDAAQVHHLRDVQRLRVDDEVIAFDGEGNEYLCVISELKRQKAVLAVKDRRKTQTQKTGLTIACAIPKGTKFDGIVDTLTQLGVDRIIPLETERVIVKIDSAGREARLMRWRRIARGAAQQSQRNTIPAVEPIASLESLLSSSRGFDLKLLPTLSGEREHLKEALAKFEGSNILVLIGPEGDFTPREIEMAKSTGFIPVSIGAYVLRVSTAVTAIAGYIRLSTAG